MKLDPAAPPAKRSHFRAVRVLLAGVLAAGALSACGIGSKPAAPTGRGDLVVELVPAHCGDRIYPYDGNCADRGGFADPVAPKVGDRVAVTGYLVRDFDKLHLLLGYPPQADGWTEVHPVTAIEELSTGTTAYQDPATARPYPIGQCPPNAMAAAYWSGQRLKDRFGDKRPDHCMTITGTIAHIRDEPDGDLHILMQVDPRFQKLLTAGNRWQWPGNPLPSDPEGHTASTAGGIGR